MLWFPWEREEDRGSSLKSRQTCIKRFWFQRGSGRIEAIL
jgi:hypothetical protein